MRGQLEGECECHHVLRGLLVHRPAAASFKAPYPAKGDMGRYLRKGGSKWQGVIESNIYSTFEVMYSSKSQILGSTVRTDKLNNPTKHARLRCTLPTVPRRWCQSPSQPPTLSTTRHDPEAEKPPRTRARTRVLSLHAGNRCGSRVMNAHSAWPLTVERRLIYHIAVRWLRTCVTGSRLHIGWQPRYSDLST